MNTEKLIFISGPSGCGKTTNAQDLCKHYNCSHYIEGLDGVYSYSHFEHKTLVLTCVPAEAIKLQFPGSRIIDFYKACHDANLVTVQNGNYSISPEILMKMLNEAWCSGNRALRYSSGIYFVSGGECKEIIKNWLEK